ncbi:xanthine dehydrogenase subunit D [Domibacillus sp. DTU_2020_1001157_1_SI_ALB_TIR_016]|uniref:xanthine dehydrogenase subunit D n=1 Tax=Domibacillus sp. DTU_2020_1001157_1_SI_ALB_TIR_016 TaxID=3077789 RepID=UPI0028EFB878|nr:xanthine dehydrogenase subunit D [Domibacillus sp. DTU_2020_1001157_1_SI_ALB_TIR_016]WNS80565.1 xanthine dehydrogenase subunit D [Domibacillus sp. DTU_2020_1001157_1_SI_ALB_TIR_016]
MKKKIRPDGKEKVTGRLKYLTDLTFPEMLWAKVLRSAYPHARILSLSTEKARQLPGVQAVITHEDVPALNGFGIVTPDQPVLCKDTVRYVGDAVAAVAAESVEIAARALELIEVHYEPLPVVDSPEKALAKSAPLLHPGGNILHRAGFQKGDIQTAFSRCVNIVEETYEVPRQLHAYMETEGGVIVPEKDGTLTVYVGTQHGFKDRFQLSRILGMPEEKIRIISSPMGGSFGGKDELNIQPYGALLALATGRPVKIHQTRQESIRSSIKRHPMSITMKTGVDQNGRLLAHQTTITADTGAYATLGPAILDFAVEHACGPYMIEAVDTKGVSVFTNNGVSGEFRGFGGNQITFALEGQMDRLAAAMGIDALELRRLNIRREQDPGPLGQRIVQTNGALEVLESAAQVYQDKKQQRPKESEWKRTGIGMAVTMHGGGLGFGRMDPAGGRLSLKENGKVEIAFGFEEAGQGILAVIEAVTTEELGCRKEDLSIVIGDTALVPSSGSTTASRGTSMVWHSLQRLKGSFIKRVLARAVQKTGAEESVLSIGPGGVWKNGKCVLSFESLAAGEEPIVVSTQFDFPVSPDAIDSAHYLYTYSGVVAQTEVDLLTGRIKVTGLHQSTAAGPVVNEMGYRGQIEGGGVMALGYTLMEDVVMTEGQYATENFDSYLVPGIQDVPFELELEAIETLPPGDHYGPRGVGEIGTVAVAPAIANAIYDAIGFRVSRLPVKPEAVLQSMERGVLHENQS